MAHEEKKQYLKQYRMLETQINRAIAEKAKWMDLATNISPVLSDMPHGEGGSDKVLDAVQHIANIDAELDREIDKLIDLRMEIDACIARIPDRKLRNVLRTVYIDGKTIAEAAEQTGYSDRHMRRILSRALDVLVCPPLT